MNNQIYSGTKRITGIVYLLPILFLCIIPGIAKTQVLDPTYIDSNLYDYIFGVGSTWSYKEASTGTIDSLVETGNIHEFTPEVWIHGEPVVGPVEYYKSYYESMTLNYQTWDQFIGFVIVREGYDWGNGGKYIFLASYTIGDKRGDTEIVAVYDSLDIYDYTFTTVTKMLVMNNPFENYRPTCYYFAKNVGLVRKEILSDDTNQVLEQWNLRYYYLVNSLVGVKLHEENQDVEFYPNPVEKQATLKVPDPGILPLELIIFNADGRNVFSKTINEQTTVLDMANLPSGIFLAHLFNCNFNKNLKIIRK